MSDELKTFTDLIRENNPENIRLIENIGMSLYISAKIKATKGEVEAATLIVKELCALKSIKSPDLEIIKAHAEGFLDAILALKLAAPILLQQPQEDKEEILPTAISVQEKVERTQLGIRRRPTVDDV